MSDIKRKRPEKTDEPRHRTSKLPDQKRATLDDLPADAEDAEGVKGGLSSALGSALRRAGTSPLR